MAEPIISDVLFLPIGEPPQVLSSVPISLEWLQGQVRGYIELVRLDARTLASLERLTGARLFSQPPPRGAVFLVVNEEGGIRGFPINPMASGIAGQVIYGPVVICAVD